MFRIPRNKAQFSDVKPVGARESVMMWAKKLSRDVTSVQSHRKLYELCH